MATVRGADLGGRQNEMAAWTPEQRRRALGRVPLLAADGTALVDWLAEHMEPRYYQRGAVLQALAQPEAHRLRLLMDGRVQMAQVRAGGRFPFVVQRGTVFGLAAAVPAIKDVDPTWFPEGFLGVEALAMDDVWVLELPKEVVIPPRLAEPLLRAEMRRLHLPELCRWIRDATGVAVRPDHLDDVLLELDLLDLQPMDRAPDDLPFAEAGMEEAPRGQTFHIARVLTVLAEPGVDLPPGLPLALLRCSDGSGRTTPPISLHGSPSCSPQGWGGE
jgi:hypothetical protein